MRCCALRGLRRPLCSSAGRAVEPDCGGGCVPVRIQGRPLPRAIHGAQPLSATLQCHLQPKFSSSQSHLYNTLSSKPKLSRYMHRLEKDVLPAMIGCRPRQALPADSASACRCLCSWRACTRAAGAWRRTAAGRRATCASRWWSAATGARASRRPCRRWTRVRVLIWLPRRRLYWDREEGACSGPLGWRVSWPLGVGAYFGRQDEAPAAASGAACQHLLQHLQLQHVPVGYVL